MTGLTMGSLFDGSGGFPLGALLNGIQPVWASEIEPFPIRVTTRRLPFMKHYGDISKMNGGKIEPVDIITFGSPCTNLSVAGKREGLDGKQSSLFFQAIRIIREMRKASNGKYPRFIVWENVPGAYSSAAGRDFHQVLTEIVRTKKETATVPMPEKHKWLSAGEIVADDFSLAWRTLDAQFWGVAQRRRRCYLVADFAGECAGKILFEFESLSGYSAKGLKERQIPSNGAADGIGTSSCTILNDQGGSRMHTSENITATLRAEEHGHQPIIVEPVDAITFDARGNGNGATVSTITGDHNGHISDYTSLVLGSNNKANLPQTLKIRSGCEGGGKGPLLQVDKSGTLSCNNDQTLFEPMAYSIGGVNSEGMKSSNPLAGIYATKTARTLDLNGGTPACNQGGIAVVDMNQEVIAFTQNQRNEVRDLHERAGALAAEPGSKQQTYIVDSAVAKPNGLAIDCRNHAASTVSATLQAKNNGGQSLNYINPVVETSYQRATGPLMANAHPGSYCGQDAYQDMLVANPYVVRRLTPKECALLQGFPKNWCDNLGDPSPNEEEIAHWHRIFEEHRLIAGTSSKPKSRRQLVKWLKEPNADSAEYRMWGNGVALPCVRFVMAGIAWLTLQELTFPS